MPYPRILCLILFFTFTAGLTAADEGGKTVFSNTAYYTPLDAGQIQKTQPVFRAQSVMSGTSGINADLFETLPDDPIGTPSLEIKRQLKDILETSRKESSTAGNPSTETPTPQPPDSQNPLPQPSPGVTSKGETIIANEILEGKNGTVAYLQDGTTVPVTLTEEGYYDQNYRKIVLKADAQTTQTNKEATPVNQILLIILAFGSTFAAIFIGFIAWDNQRRLEEAITSQNQRLTGAGTDTFSNDFNSLEPETFSFSIDSASAGRFDSFDSGTSFRTIA